MTRFTSSQLVSVVVQHHPARRDTVTRLVAQLEAEQAQPRLVEDPDPDAGPGPWRSYRRCLTVDTDASHLLVVQDDATMAPGWATAVRRIIREVPEHVVCLWHGEYPRTSALECYRAAEAGVTLVPITVAQWLPLVAVVWPVDLARRCASDIGDVIIPYADDGLVGRWCNERVHGRVCVAVPNIVQHDDVEPSLMGRVQTQRRTSMCYAGSYPIRRVRWRLG